jgi:hypothetical protein
MLKFFIFTYNKKYRIEEIACTPDLLLLLRWLPEHDGRQEIMGDHPDQAIHHFCYP